MTHPICDECETVAHCSKKGCIPLTPRSMSSAPGVSWWHVIVELERGGYTHAATGAAVGVSRTAVESWKNRNVEPGHDYGERLVSLWRVVTGRARDDLPRKLDQILSAASFR